MRIALILTVLLVAAVCSSDAWGVRRIIRRVRRAISPVWRKLKPIAVQSARCYVLTKAVEAGLAALGKRSVTEFDSNADGFLDQSELETFLSPRDASNLLQLNGSDKIDLEDFLQAIERARRFSENTE